MQILGKLMTHIRLITGMAKATDTDVVAAFETGSLTQAEWARMVQRCRACSWADGCVDWLDAHETAATPPETCPNKKRFETLQRRLESEEA